MKILIKEGYDVYAIIPRGKYYDKFHGYGIKTIEFNIKRSSLNPFREIDTILGLAKILKDRKFDILHTFTIKPNIYGSIAGRLARIPIIINYVEGLGYVYTEDNTKALILRIITSLLYRISFAIANRIIFLNPDDMEDLKKYTGSGKSRLIKGTGVDVNYFSPGTANRLEVDNLRKELAIDKNTIVITLIARLIWHKGIRELVEAAKLISERHDNLVFLFVGGIDDGNPNAIQRIYSGISKATIHTIPGGKGRYQDNIGNHRCVRITDLL
jgi:N,N'-diacetylbacillosaminyl-diphospho-undecaprenol alpha-1,3-N-acetylgalactosaminyltransferase